MAKTSSGRQLLRGWKVYSVVFSDRVQGLKTFLDEVHLQNREKRSSSLEDCMSGYTKLFSTILSSTIWQEDDRTRLVWITMLAMSNRDGLVEASIPGLAKMANVPLAATERALKKFLSPDRYSTTQDYNGRRIEKVDGGWRLLNYGKFREMMSREDQREKSRERMRRMRERQGVGVLRSVTLSDDCYDIAESREQKQKHVPPLPPKGGSPSLPWEVVCWNDNCGSLPKVQHVGPSRMRHLLARRKEEFWHKNFEAAMSKIFASKFCNGQNDRDWKATFTWLVERPDALAKVIEGNYDNGKNSKERGRVNPRNEGICRGPTDYAALAKAKSALAHEEYLARVASSKAR